MRIRDLMNKSVVSITPDESAALAARLLSRHDLGALPVCDRSGQLCGIVTDRDIVLRCIAAGEDPGRVPVGDIMSIAPITVSPEQSITEAAHRMAHSQIRRLPVVENGSVVGMLSLGDLARSRKWESEAAQTLSDVCSRIRQKRG